MSRILVADDQGQNRYYLEALLRGHGFDVVTTENGGQALEEARKVPPDLMISDILMPVMDGFELCRIWKTDEHLKVIPFLFYTATYTEPKDERFALSLGADRFLIKPMEPEALLAAIREGLQEGESRRDASLASEMDFLRQHNEVLFRKLDKKIRDLEASQQLVSNLLDNSPSLIYIVDREGRFLHLNRQLEISMRHPRREIVGRTRDAFLPADVAAAFRTNDLQVLNSGHPITFEEVGREPDGEHTYFTVKFPLRDSEGHPCAICGISTDITDKKHLERDLQRVADLQVMLYRVNRAIRSAESEEELLEAVCRICVEHGKLDLAWVGDRPLAGAPLRSRFSAGPLAAYVEGLEIPLDPADPRAHSPAAAALREEENALCQDWDLDPSVAPWRSRTSQFGIRASAALPIRRDGQVVSVLNLYSVHSGFFTTDRMAFVEEMIQDIGHALDSMAHAQRRREAEQTLVGREMEYQAAFDQGAIGLAKVSLEGRFLHVNTRLCELMGYEPEEIVGHHFQEFTHPDDRTLSASQLEHARSAPLERYHFQKRYLRKDGETVWMDLSGGPVRDPNGKVLYLLSAFEDVTELKRAESKLREEASKLQTLLGAIPDLVWLKDVNGVYRFANPRFEAFFGKPAADIVGKTDYDFVDRDLADFFRKHDRMAMEKGGPSVNEEWVTFASDGHRELLETIKTPLPDPSGQVTGVLGIARNITQLRLDQALLRKLSRAIEQNTAAVVITDREGRIEYVNPRFTEITGYGVEETLGQNPRILRSGVTPSDVYAQLWATILGGRVWRGELQNRKKDGELYWATLSISPILDESGSITHFVALQEDITARVRMGEQLRESEEQYRSLFKNMLNGFALCQMMYDVQGRAEDFVYLAVNHSFETQTGLRDVLGKRVSEVIPGFQETNPEVLELYGRVARTAVPESFETYVKPLDMWFDISVYSPRPDHFVAVFNVITERKRAEAAVKAQLHELQRWHEATLGREDRILDLKREVNDLRARLGLPPRYGSAGGQGTGEGPP